MYSNIIKNMERQTCRSIYVLSVYTHNYYIGFLVLTIVVFLVVEIVFLKF